MTSVVYVTGQGVVSGGYIMGQGPGGVPVAIPVQQPGGVVIVPGVHPQMVHKCTKCLQQGPQEDNHRCSLHLELKWLRCLPLEL